MKKKLFIILIVLLALFVSIYFFFIRDNGKKEIQIKKIDSIENYSYHLYENQSKEYKKLFADLAKILKKDPIEEDEYVSIISKMFIIDFYTLSNKPTNLNIGGTQFVYSGMVENFKVNANDTLYKYVENNIYGDRKQELPTVKNVEVLDIKTVTYLYNDNVDKFAYQVKVKWTYEKDLGYEDNKILYFVHEDKVLSLVEMK